MEILNGKDFRNFVRMVKILPPLIKLLSEPENSTECHTMGLDAPADDMMLVRPDPDLNIPS